MHSTNDSISTMCFMPQATVFTTKKTIGREKIYCGNMSTLKFMVVSLHYSEGGKREGLKMKIKLFIHLRQRFFNNDT